MNNRKVVDKIKQALEKDDIRKVSRHNRYAKDITYEQAIDLMDYMYKKGKLPAFSADVTDFKNLLKRKAKTQGDRRMEHRDAEKFLELF